MTPEQVVLDAARRLEEQGHRATSQRLALVAALVQQGGCVTPQSLHLYLRRTSPRMGLATVYRTLELLVGCGLAERLVQPNSEVCYAYCSSQHHHHAICVRCGLTVEVAGCPLPDVQRSIERQTAFALSDHSVTFFGTCRTCQEAIATGRPLRRRVPRPASPAS